MNTKDTTAPKANGAPEAPHIQYDADARRKAHPELNPYSALSYCYELESKLLAVTAQRDELLAAAEFTLNQLDNMLSDDFQLGADKPSRDKLRAAIANCQKGDQ
jgi:hypothetical protein